MTRKLLSIVLLLLYTTQLVSASERDSTLVVKVFNHGLNDTKNLFLSPSKWDKTDWLIAGSASAATAALVLWADQPVYDYMNTLHTPNRDLFFKNTEPLGNYYPFALMGATLLTGVISKNNYHVETSFIAAESYLLTGLLAQLAKTTIGRSRPNDQGTTDPHQWNGPFFKGNSFFSGHTSTVFAVASVYAWRYKETVWVPVLSYGLATLGGLERIYDNRHWSSDVLMGAVVGTATGLFLCKQWEKESIRFFPVANMGGAGLSMVIPIQ